MRIRCAEGDEPRTRAALAARGWAAERSLTWLVVRDASPDAVNEALAAGGAHSRVAVRERIGKLVGWVLDREGRLEGRAVNVKALVARVLEDGGLAGRYAPRDEAALLAGAGALHERLMATGAALLAWDEFLDLFCAPRTPAG